MITITIVTAIIMRPTEAIPLIVTLSSIIITVALVLAVWIPRFYRSIVFRLESDHVYARFGVW